MIIENKKYEIDFLKAFAILLIVFYNLNPNFLPGGFLGLDIFFVLIGYLISFSYFNKGVKDNFIKFCKRTLKNFYPTTVICIIISSILTITFLNPPLWIALKDAKWVLLGVQNINLFLKTNNFNNFEMGDLIFDQFWSLSVIAQSCFIFSSFWYFLSDFSLKRFFKQILLLTLTSFILTLFVFFNYEENKFSLYFLPFYRFWEIGLGIISYYFAEQIFVSEFKIKLFKNIAFLRKINLFPELALLFILILLLFSNISSLISILFACLITSILILNIRLNKNSILRKFSSNKICTWISSRSYGIYIFHWMFIIIFKSIIGYENFLFYLFVLFSTFLINTRLTGSSDIHNNNIDKKIKERIFETKSSIFILFIALNSVIFSQKMITFGTKFKTYDTYNSHFFSFIGLANKEKTKAHKGLMYWEDKVRECHHKFNSSSKSQLVEKCLNNKSSKGKNDLNFYILGDSHAGTLLPMVNETKKNISTKKISLKNVHINSFIDIISNKKPFDFEYVRNNINKNDIVLVHFFSGKFVDNKLTNEENKNFVNYFQDFSSEIISKGGFIIFIKDNARLKNDIRIDKCILQDNIGIKNSCKILKSEVYLKRRNSEILIEKIKNNIPSERILIYDLLDDMCLDNYCDYKNDLNQLVMQDHNHISYNESLRQSIRFREFINNIFIKRII